MRVCTIFLACALTVASCGRPAATRQYELRGQVLAVEPARSEVLIKHEAVKDFMPAMTMPFKVKDASLLSGKRPGDLVTATLVYDEVAPYLSALTTTGHEALEAPAVVSD